MHMMLLQHGVPVAVAAASSTAAHTWESSLAKNPIVLADHLFVEQAQCCAEEIPAGKRSTGQHSSCDVFMCSACVLGGGGGLGSVWGLTANSVAVLRRCIGSRMYFSVCPQSQSVLPSLSRQAQDRSMPHPCREL